MEGRSDTVENGETSQKTQQKTRRKALKITKQLHVQNWHVQSGTGGQTSFHLPFYIVRYHYNLLTLYVH